MEVLNCEEADIATVNLQIVDYYSSFGNFIDREKNAEYGVSST